MQSGVGLSGQAERSDLNETQGQGPEAGPSAQDFSLRVVAGPDVDKTLLVHAGAATRSYLGKSPISDLCLSDLRVSRRHLALEVAGKQLLVEDLGSTNGTFVNGLQVRSAFLNGGETLRLGDTSITVHAHTDGSAPKLPDASRFGRVIGDSVAMRKIYPLLAKLAASSVPMVIEGETGTGKELVAEAIHEAGPRADAPFVVFDCTTVPPNLVESALFGHERGSFTGAVSARQGVFEQAHKGTLFLDEIGDLEIALQAKLLRALERREVQRVGGSTWLKVDVRIVAATRRDLEKMIQAQTFRDDLFYRLAVARVELPSLRSRDGDIEVLAKYFWQQLGGIIDELPPNAMAGFKAYDWPGNVRELYNAVSHTMALGELSHLPSRSSASLVTETLPSTRAEPPSADVIQSVIDQEVAFPEARNKVMREFERRFLQAILERHGGNVSKASRASGIQRRFFYVLRARQET
jgi:two-component system, NtrC family, response regulator HydG